MPEKKSRANRATKPKPWTSLELETLRSHGSLGAPALADELGRSVSSVRCAAHRHGCSLRRPRERRGTLLGQPRGMSLRELLPNESDPRIRALAVARAALDRDAELCPECSLRPIRVERTGLCRVCHERRLAEAHREAIAEIQARRENWAARQELHRQRELAEAGR